MDTVPLPSAAAIEKLENGKNLWFASTRPDGRPHLTPVWFAYQGGLLYVCIEPEGVKGRNLSQNPHVTVALEDGLHPLICEGVARPIDKPWPKAVTDSYTQKYEWDILNETQYTRLFEISPRKWLEW